MRLVALIFTGLFCATLWLALLVATGFSSLIQAIGLFGVLLLAGRSG